jgi:hypothetical protein
MMKKQWAERKRKSSERRQWKAEVPVRFHRGVIDRLEDMMLSDGPASSTPVSGSVRNDRASSQSRTTYAVRCFIPAEGRPCARTL